MDLTGPIGAIAYLASHPDAICIADPDSRIVFVTPAFCDLFGYSDYQCLLGRCISDLIGEGILHPHNDDMSRMISNGVRSTRFAIEGVVCGRKADGSRFDVFIGDRQMFRGGRKIFMSCVARLPNPAGE